MPFEVIHRGKPESPADLPIEAYARVSRVGGRISGAGFISVEEQVDAFHRSVPPGHYLKAIYVELDESGGNDQRSGWQEVRSHVLDGSSKGTMVVRVDRFSRSVRDGVEAAEELVDKGARFISCYENCDVSTPEGKWMFQNLLANAELQLGQIRRSWKSAIDRAHDRGVYISAWPPQGYLRTNGHLIEGPLKPAIEELFLRRAAGDSWIRISDEMNISEWRPDWTPRSTQIAYEKQTLPLRVRNRVDKVIDELLIDAGLPRATWEAGGADTKVRGLWKEVALFLQTTEQRPFWTPNSIRDIVTNKVYKGTLVYMGKPEERHGRIKPPTFMTEREDFHPALVTADLWRRANKPQRMQARNETTANQVACRGIVTCASCGRTLVVGATTISSGTRTGARVPILYCQGRSSRGRCQAPPALQALPLDDYLKHCVRAWLLERRETPGAEVLIARERLQEARAAHEEASADYREYAMPSTRKAIGDNALWEEGLAEAKALLDARAQAYEREQRAAAVESLADSNVYEMLDEYTPLELRRVFQAVFEEVQVQKAKRIGPRAQPFDERVSLRFYGSGERSVVDVVV